MKSLRLKSSQSAGFMGVALSSLDGYVHRKNNGFGSHSVSPSKTELGFDAMCFPPHTKTVIATLERADVKNLVIISWVGHKAEGLLRMTVDRYSKGKHLKSSHISSSLKCITFSRCWNAGV